MPGHWRGLQKSKVKIPEELVAAEAEEKARIEQQRLEAEEKEAEKEAERETEKLKRRAAQLELSQIGTWEREDEELIKKNLTSS